MSWNKKTLQDTIRKKLSEELFVVVSNREPYIHHLEGEEIALQVPASGLTIALDPVMRACGGLWVAHGSGNADNRVVDEQDHVRVPPQSPAYTLRRLWLTKEEEEKYYYGFSNEALWPLCHIAYTRPVFRQEDWEMYSAVNRRFAEAVLEEIGSRKAFVFIQDYHFALLPRLLKRPNIRTAQFWHIPWPNAEAFRVCPWAEELLDGLLGNDLLGFHIQYHCQNFLDAVDRFLEARIDRERSDITRAGHTTMVRPFPISVDFSEISASAAGPQVEAKMREFIQHYGLRNQLIGLGVDRVDYTKGIPERLQAIDRFFQRYPEFQGKMVFVQVGVPSRTHIGFYQQLQENLASQVATLNWKYQRGGWKPILYIDEHVNAENLRAWYRLANFCVVSSLHDGMNMVAKEFVASRVDEDGVLVLSRFTGAARELSDAVLINPFAVDQVAHQIHEALAMSAEERKKRMRKLRDQVREANIYRWAGQVLSTLFKFEFSE